MQLLARRLQQIFLAETIVVSRLIGLQCLLDTWMTPNSRRFPPLIFFYNVGVRGHDRLEKFRGTGESLAKWTGPRWKIGSEDSAALKGSDVARTPLEARTGTDEPDNSIGRAQYGRAGFMQGVSKGDRSF